MTRFLFTTAVAAACCGMTAASHAAAATTTTTTFSVPNGQLLSTPLLEDLPTDCRNETWGPGGGGSGALRVMSWHIHYNTNTTSQQLFYNAFIAKFAALFPPTQAHGFTKHQCPFGPNFGGPDWKYICSLEGPYQEHSVGVTLKGSPWNGPQRAFVVPPAYIDEAWVWAQANKFEADVLKHANTGCMHDDHGLRAEWNSTLRDKCSLKDSGCKGTCGELIKQYPCDKFYGPGQKFAGFCDKTCGFAPSNPTINTLEFPCNMPGTGCNDSLFAGPPACNCASSLPLPNDAPANSCKFCTAKGGEVPPPPDGHFW